MHVYMCTYIMHLDSLFADLFVRMDLQATSCLFCLSVIDGTCS